MKIEFDPPKSEKNAKSRGLPFDRAADLDWANAVIIADTRNPYSESRFVVIGYLDGRLHVACFTPIPGGIRIISFRKANRREARKHGKPITLDE